jgi:hypothetical protein
VRVRVAVVHDGGRFEPPRLRLADNTACDMQSALHSPRDEVQYEGTPAPVNTLLLVKIALSEPREAVMVASSCRHQPIPGWTLRQTRKAFRGPWPMIIPVNGRNGLTQSPV